MLFCAGSVAGRGKLSGVKSFLSGFGHLVAVLTACGAADFLVTTQTVNMVGSFQAGFVDMKNFRVFQFL